MVVYILDTQKEYRYINDTWKEIPNDLVNGHEHENKDVLDNITIQDITNWNAKSDFSGSYNDLTDLPALPTKFSDLTNDMNLALILASLGLASAGAVLVSRKKLTKANR